MRARNICFLGQDISVPDYLEDSKNRENDLFCDHIKMSLLVSKEIEQLISNSLLQVLSRLIDKS